MGLPKNKNIYKLDPLTYAKSPDSIPEYMQRAMANILMDYRDGKRRRPGGMKDQWITAFNIISAKFGRDFKYLQKSPLKRGELKITGVAKRRVQENYKERAEAGQRRRARRVKGKPAAKKPVPPSTKLRFFKQFVKKLQQELES